MSENLPCNKCVKGRLQWNGGKSVRTCGYLLNKKVTGQSVKSVTIGLEIAERRAKGLSTVG